ncbi:MAG: hypothetical protein M3331_05260 [Actinomycetota bacterium]|nr:hypothetical protein [Actinomycetota bacterium]
MGREISVSLSDEEFERLQRAIRDGQFQSEAAALREGLAHVLVRRLDSSKVAEAYRRAYEHEPQDPRVGEAGAKLVGEMLEEDERETG